MKSHRSLTLRRFVLALIAVGAVTSALLIADGAGAINSSAVARESRPTCPRRSAARALPASRRC
jgi:hypothetical protein